jgi:hypothetical protein
MNDQEKDKVIVEALGGCSHDWEYWSPIRLCSENSDYQCKKCKAWRSEKDISLATPEGFFWWWERAQKMEWWDEFISEEISQDSNTRNYDLEVINPTQGRDALYEFWVGRSKGR